MNSGIRMSLAALAATTWIGCGDDDHDHLHDAATTVTDGGALETGAGDGAGDETGAATALTLFASEGETLVAFDVATGTQRAGAIANVKGPTDMQALASGHLLVNLTGSNEILVVDARTFREIKRIPSSTRGGTRPVHSFVTPAIGGKQYWVANNDGDGTAATNSVVFIDLVASSPTFLTAVGELAIGIGHHKNAFSLTKARVSISNIADCANVMQVIDYGDATRPTLVHKWSAMELDPARTCSAMAGVAPHGGAAANGRGYHNLTGWGAILSVAQDADPPTFKLLATKGTGAGYTKAGKNGQQVYSLQRTPREGTGGADCQIGQLVVVDAAGDAIAAEVPILLAGAGCTAKLPAHAAAAGPDHIKLSHDGKTLFVTTQAGAAMAGMPATYSDQLVVFDLTDPARPVQKASIAVGKHNGHRGMSLTGDGNWLFVVNNADRTVSQVDATALSVVRTLTLKENPAQLAAWGSAEGPSAQTGPQ